MKAAFVALLLFLAQHRESMDRYVQQLARMQARYPRDSFVIAEGDRDPIRDAHTPSRLEAGANDRNNLRLTTWPAVVSFQYPAPVDLYVAVEQVDRITGEVVNGSGETLDRFQYRDEGQEGDAANGDGIYSARLTHLPKPPLAEAYLVRIEAVRGTTVVRAASGFLYSRPTARLTGVYYDSLRNGDMILTADVQVGERGRVYAEAVVATMNGTPIGFAQQAATLDPGSHHIELRFFGLMFHDRRAAGPYRIASIVLRTTDVMPNAIGPLLQDVHITRAYSLQQLRNLPFASRGDDPPARARRDD